jgi:hypothetical protein
MANEKKIPKSNPVAKDLARKTVTLTLYAGRVTRDKNDNPKNVVFEIAGAMDKAKAQKASYNLAMVYGNATEHEVGELVEVTIRKLPKSAA